MLVIVGLGFDTPSLLVPGVTLLLLAVGAVAWVELASRGGALERAPGPRRLGEDELYPLELRVSGTLLRPPGGRLSDPLLSAAHPVGPRWPRLLQRRVGLRGPGRRVLGPARLLVRDPLGLWSRELRSDPAGELVVLPRIEPVVAATQGGESLGALGGAGASPQQRVAQVTQLEVDGLRPYRAGSPASRIHWPAVARH